MKKAVYFLPVLIAILYTSCESPNKEEVGTAYYQEAYRPAIHFSPEANWMNDPNGMVYYEGEYHLFYQYYPDSTVWGTMHWGHAISTDLLHWEHLPVALFPDELGLIFSGSAVIDWNNTSGLQDGEHPPMIAIFTQHLMAGEKAGRNDFQVQSIAYSNDKGRSWTMYEGNPVIPNPGIRDFRDPKVFWHEDSEKWIMIFAAGDRVKLYNSPNLIDWEFLSDFGKSLGAHGGVWECPDLFKLQTQTGESHWVMLVSINPGGPNGGSATQYFVGDFDGQTFNTEQPETKWLDYGRDNYAGVTWSDIPEKDGRRLFIGWMSNWDYAQVVPTHKWRSAMTLPRSLHLVNKDGDHLVTSRPVRELEQLEQTGLSIQNVILEEEQLFSINYADELQIPITAPFRTQIVIDANKTTGADYGLLLRNSENDVYRLSIRNNRLFSDRRASGLVDFEARFATQEHLSGTFQPDAEGKITLDIFLDKSSIELFVNNGEVVITDLLFPTGFNFYNEAYLYTLDGNLHFDSMQTNYLQSIWSNPPDTE